MRKKRSDDSSEAKKKRAFREVRADRATKRDEDEFIEQWHWKRIRVRQESKKFRIIFYKQTTKYPATCKLKSLSLYRHAFIGWDAISRSSTIGQGRKEFQSIS